MITERDFMTPKEVAKLFKMSIRHVQYLAMAGDLKCIKPFGRILIYKKAVAEKIGCKVEEL